MHINESIILWVVIIQAFILVEIFLVSNIEILEISVQGQRLVYVALSLRG